MKKFKEWLSDYLRYILLIIGALLAFTLITFGVQTWLIVKRAGSPQTANTQTEETQDASSKGGAIEILTEAVTERASESETEKETQTETSSETEHQSETSLETETDASSAQPKETAASAEDAVDSQTSDDTSDSSSQAETSDTSAATEAAETSGTDIAPETSAPVQTEQIVVQTEILAETQAPEPETEAPYQPVYLTMKGACYIRSYADYGDNIIGEYPAGTVVEFLEDAGGWYKVRVDGMV